MKKIVRIIGICLTAGVMLVACGTYAQQNSGEQSGQQRGGRGGPPEEAFTACENLVVDDACSVETPEGTLAGSCQLAPRDERMVCMPAR